MFKFLFLLPVLVSGEFSGGNAEYGCCPMKMYETPNGHYDQFEHYMYDPEWTREYGCIDGCIYIKKGSMDKYCFAPGDMDVTCNPEYTQQPMTHPTMNMNSTKYPTYTMPPSHTYNNTMYPTMAPSNTYNNTMYPTMAPSFSYGMNDTTTSSGCTCGKKKPGTESKDTRIVGGFEAEVMEWPWMAAISFSPTGSGLSYGCGASLISAEWLVTAAHCFYQDGLQTISAAQITIVLGDHDKSIEIETTKLVQYVDKIVIHPQYNDATSLNDIALIKMTTKVDINVYTPICLPGPTDSFFGDAWVYGWGTLYSNGPQPNILNEIALPLVDFNVCKSVMGLLGVQIEPGMICAGGMAEKDSCQGDSGGPLSMEKDGKQVLIGAVSFGIGCGELGKYGVYADVKYYIEWINSVSLGATFCPN